MAIREMGCEVEGGMELAQHRVQWRTLVLETLKLHVRLSQCYYFDHYVGAYVLMSWQP
jgi:hypothetical protein